MPPQEGMDPWQQQPSGGSNWREHQGYYGESRQQRQQPYGGGGAQASPYPPQYRQARQPPFAMRRMPPYPGEGYSRGGRGGEGYYDRSGGWQEQQSSPQRPMQQGPPPYRSEERPYMPHYEEMRSLEHPRLEGAPQAPPPPSVRIQFRPNSNRHRRQPSHPSRKSPSPTKKEKSAKSSDGKEKKDKDALSLLAKVSFAMQTSPSGSQDEEENGKEKEGEESEKQSPNRKEKDKNPSPTDQKLPEASPLVAPTNSDLSPITPETFAKASSATAGSPEHKRSHSGGSGVIRTPRGHLTPLITPASSAAAMTPRHHHRRHSSGGVDKLYHQRWTSFAEGPLTPHAYSPYPPPVPPPPGSDYPRDYLTMEQIATPPAPGTGHRGGSPARQRREGAPPQPYLPHTPYREQQGWDRAGPPPSDPSVWRSRDGYEQRYPEDYPAVVPRGSSYDEEAPPPSRYRYPPPETYGEGRGGRGGEYYGWRETQQQYEGQGPYTTPPHQLRRRPPDSSTPRRMPYSMQQQQPPYSQQQQPQPHHTVTPPSRDLRQRHPHQAPPPPEAQQGEAMYATAPYTYVQQPRLEEKTILRKKFSWKHYPELERFLIANRDEYLRHSALNYTAEQKQYNNWLTERLLEVAARHNYEFDPEEFNFVAVRDRIRCYYKSYVQTARKRGIAFPGLKSPTKKARSSQEEVTTTTETEVSKAGIEETTPATAADNGGGIPVSGSGDKEEEPPTGTQYEEAAKPQDDSEEGAPTAVS